MLKKLLQVTSMILVLAMLVQLTPLDVLAANSRVDDPVESQYEPEVYDIFAGDGALEANDDSILSEIEEKREESVKHFQLNDGSIVAAVYDVPVHELNDDGEWEEIDNTLSAVTNSKGTKTLAKNGGSTDVTFDLNANNGKLLTITTEYGAITWSLNNASSKAAAATYTEPVVEDNYTKLAVKSVSGIVTYKNVMPSVSLDYQLLGNDVKENITLASKSAVRSFSFTLGCANMTAKLEDNNVVITNADGEVVRVISAPYMIDANDNISDDVVVSLAPIKNGYTVTITPDKDWLASDDRAYPVIIDPTITKTYTNSTVDNTSVNSRNPSSNAMYQYGALYVGRESSSYNNLRGAFKFTLPTTITESDMIIDAYVKLTQRNYFSGSADSVTVNIHQITSNMALSSLTWNGLNGNYNSIVLDSQIASASTKESHFKWDGLVKKSAVRESTKRQNPESKWSVAERRFRILSSA